MSTMSFAHNILCFSVSCGSKFLSGIISHQTEELYFSISSTVELLVTNTVFVYLKMSSLCLHFLKDDFV